MKNTNNLYKKIIKYLFVCCLLTILSLSCSAKHLHNEKYYQEIWCKANNGILEYQNDDSTRVDCLTENNAVEFDFAAKWAESIGQALYYQKKTQKRGKVVLILENTEKEMKYFNRVKELSIDYNFDCEYITPLKAEKLK